MRFRANSKSALGVFWMVLSFAFSIFSSTTSITSFRHSMRAVPLLSQWREARHGTPLSINRLNWSP
jgi:hypothetical protein